MVFFSGTPPEPNTAVTLGLEFAFGLVAGALGVWGCFGFRAVGMYGRLFKLVFIGGAIMVLFVLVAVALEPGQWPKALALALGIAITGGWGGRRLYRRHLRIEGPAARRGVRGMLAAAWAGLSLSPGAGGLIVRKWFRPFDYLYGVAIYLTFTGAVATAGKAAQAEDLVTRVGVVIALFCYSQLTTNLLYRLLNSVLEREYLAQRGLHYVLAGLPLAAAISVDVALSASPAGPAFRLLLLVAAWRLTALRPTSVLKTLKALRRRWRPVAVSS